MHKVSIIGLGTWGNKILNSINNYVEIVDNEEADWIIISTPNDLHYEQVKYWLNKKKNVFCEKPLTLTLESSKELFKIADKNSVKLYVDDVFLWRNDLPPLPAHFKWNKSNNSNFLDRLAYHHFYLWINNNPNPKIKEVKVLSKDKFVITLEDNTRGYFDYSNSTVKHHFINFKEIKVPNNNPLKEMLLDVFDGKVNFEKNKNLTLNTTYLVETVKSTLYPSALVVGGGIFGTTAAVTLANNGFNVTLHEELDDIMKCATGINQYRLHKGYHYPRSISTAMECKKGLQSFKQKYYDSVVNGSVDHLYAIASEESLTSSDEYLKFLDKVNLPYDTIEPLPSTNLTVKVTEELFDSLTLKNIVKSKLYSNGVRILTNKSTSKKDFKDYDIVVLATYSKLNKLLENQTEYQFEVCEKPLVKLPSKYKNKSIVVMDGPFMCMDPYGDSEYHVLGNVVHAIHESNIGYKPKVTYLKDYINKGLIKNPKYSNISKFIETGKKFFRDFEDMEHIGSFYTVRTVLKNREHDDARPTLVKKENSKVYSLFSGKIDTCVDASDELINLIQNNNE